MHSWEREGGGWKVGNIKTRERERGRGCDMHTIKIYMGSTCVASVYTIHAIFIIVRLCLLYTTVM